MILTIDIGNSCIKYAQWHDDGIVNRHRIDYAAEKSIAAFDELFLGLDKPSRVFVVCVAGEVIQSQLCDWVMSHWRLDIEVLQTQKHYKNIVNAYADPAQHGADRWAGIVAGHQLYSDFSVCVVSVGTATTLDFINQNGRHLGGYILPSYMSMRASILSSTANVSSDEGGFLTNNDIPLNTSDAVNQGCYILLQAGIREICRIAQNKVEGPLKVVLTGGFAQTVLKYSDMPEMMHEPDLVMQGLYIIMKEQGDGVSG